jgi:hypothetical protein
MAPILSLPTWLLYLIMLPLLPHHHKWNYRTRGIITLQEWHTGATELQAQFNLIFWVSGITILTLLATLIS